VIWIYSKTPRLKRILLASHILLFLVLASIAFLNPAVGGEGDTIMHFFWANQALSDPDALFRSWAKPFFTLFAAPWTLFGFAGIKVFNILCGVAASYFTSLYAIEKQWLRPFLIPLIAFSGPAFISYLNTGLTEPFAALVLILGLYLLNKGQSDKRMAFAAYSLLSFLPFCRSEAQVLLPLFALYGLLNKQLKYVPLLALGTLSYSIIGSYFRGDILWVFNSPYVAGASVYGSGTWSHYLERLNIMLSMPINLSFLVGLVLMLIIAFRKKAWAQNELLVIALPSLIFILAHSIVWTLGIYASAGLERVLILIFPLLWLISLYFLNTIVRYIPAKLNIVAAIVFFGLSGYSTIDRPHELKKYYQQAYAIGPYQKFLKKKVFPHVKEKYPDFRDKQLVSDLPYFSLLSGHNPLNPEEQVNWQRVELELYSQIDSNALFLWDSHNVPFYTKVDEEYLRSISWLNIQKEWEMGGRKYILLTSNKR